jgi:pantothenate kinase-related protein Tda10
VEAICHHLQSTQRHGQQQQRQGQPLIISVHGPPGVGKTYSHQLLARALYSSNYTQATRCPGPHCGGYKV